jgi:dephospho-CoA kinase
MDKVVIGFAGKIASGKSSVSEALAVRLGWPRASFGDYVRKQTRIRGLNQDRTMLKAIGAEVLERNLEQFCQSVLSEAGCLPEKAGIIERAVEILKRLTSPSRFFLVFVSINESLRDIRLRQRESQDFQDKQRIDTHSTESEVDDPAAKADLVIDGTKPLLDLVDQVTAYVAVNIQKAI